MYILLGFPTTFPFGCTVSTITEMIHMLFHVLLRIYNGILHVIWYDPMHWNTLQLERGVFFQNKIANTNS